MELRSGAGSYRAGRRCTDTDRKLHSYLEDWRTSSWECTKFQLVRLFSVCRIVTHMYRASLGLWQTMRVMDKRLQPVAQLLNPLFQNSNVLDYGMLAYSFLHCALSRSICAYVVKARPPSPKDESRLLHLHLGFKARYRDTFSLRLQYFVNQARHEVRAYLGEF